MAYKAVDNIIIENARIIFRNCALLEPDLDQRVRGREWGIGKITGRWMQEILHPSPCLYFLNEKSGIP